LLPIPVVYRVPNPIPISAVLISRDAEANIADTLVALADFPEVVVYDNGSEDRTVEIARGFSNVIVHQGEFFGYGPTKNHAASLATNDWILSVDCDERVTPELLASIRAIDWDSVSVVYSIRRLNFFRGKRVRFSGWGNDWLLRLYNRKVTGLTEAAVHENVVLPPGGVIVKLDGVLIHDAIREIGDFLVKIERYSELRRKEKRHIYSPGVIFLRSLWAFLRTYFFQLGILDGWRGLVIAVCEANGVFFKYMMPYADRAAEKENAPGAPDRPDSHNA
jgi:glycosyltransferase involved in cell wall biosynthesis